MINKNFIIKIYKVFFYKLRKYSINLSKKNWTDLTNISIRNVFTIYENKLLRLKSYVSL